MNQATLRFFGIVALVLSLFVYFIYGGSNAPQNQKRQSEGEEDKVPEIAPSVIVHTENGGEVAIDSFRGKYLLLHFWASWCAPCREELPSLEAYLETLKSQPNFASLLVSEDEGGAKGIAGFVKKLNLKGPYLFDPDGSAAEAFGTNKLPETYFIAPDGHILKKWAGPANWQNPALRKRILQELTAPAL